MLKKLFILNIFYLLAAAAAYCYYEEDIAEMEYSKYGKIYDTESIAERLNRLENDFFGMSQTGDINSRIDKLAKLAENSKRSAVINPLKDYYPGTKKSSVQNLWNGVSSVFGDNNGIMTGFTPSLGSYDFYDWGYHNNTYKKGFWNFWKKPKGYIHDNKRYNSRFYNKYINLNKKYNPPPPLNYKTGHYKSNAFRRIYYDAPPDITTRSSVRIIKD